MMHPDTWKAIERRRRANRNKGPMPQPHVVIPKYHTPSCTCHDCMTAGQHRADYDKAKALEGTGAK